MAKKENEALETEREEAVDQDHAELRVYELGFHIDSELPTEEAKKTYEAMRNRIAAQGEVVAEGEPEKIQLAYTISRMETTGRRDFNSAFFAWIAYETTGAGHQDVIDAATSESRIIRFIDIRTDREAAKHSAEVHEMMVRTAAPTDEEEVSEEAADAQLDSALKEAGVS